MAKSKSASLLLNELSELDHTSLDQENPRGNYGPFQKT
jgi:hypothetical protein